MMSCLDLSVTKKLNGSASDIISNLPDGILENILMHMPLRDAVRTSVLSKKWRHSWTILQHLVFDKTLCNVSLDGPVLHQKKVLLIIYQVLYRIQTVRKFSLSIPVGSCPEIDNLIIRLASAHIEELTLHIWHTSPHKLPLCLFSYHKLSHLDLCNCVFSPPANFRGFSLLISLELSYVSISEESFVKLVSCCPLLEDLKFIMYRETTYGHIEIDTPSLKTSRFIGTFKSVCFKNASRLATVCLCLKKSASQVEPTKDGRFFTNLPALENLEIDRHYMKSLLAGIGKVPPPRQHLKILKLCGICLNFKLESALLLLCLMLSPKLQILKIEVSYPEQVFPTITYPERWQKFRFGQLRDVYVDFLLGRPAEIEFLKIILTSSPVLEKMVIRPHRDLMDKGFNMLKELSDCGRLSPKARVPIL